MSITIPASSRDLTMHLTIHGLDATIAVPPRSFPFVHGCKIPLQRKFFVPCGAPADRERSWSLERCSTHHPWQRSDLRVVLVHPQIPQNAGNVARTCAATGVPLHLVGPLGFEVDDKKLKRAGLDYWDAVTVNIWKDFDEFYEFYRNTPGPKRLIAFSKYGKRHYAVDGQYCTGDWLLFGAETTGLPEAAHLAAEASGGGIVKIPMHNYKHVRSLNLATSVGIGTFEALRQLDGPVLPADDDDT